MALRQRGYTFEPPLNAALRACSTDIRLIAKGDRPFLIASTYDGYHNLYSDSFRFAYLDSYRFGKRIGFYNLWFCKKWRFPKLTAGPPGRFFFHPVRLQRRGEPLSYSASRHWPRRKKIQAKSFAILKHIHTHRCKAA